MALNLGRLSIDSRNLFKAYEGDDSEKFTNFYGYIFNKPHRQLLNDIIELRDALNHVKFDGQVLLFNDSKKVYHEGDVVIYDYGVYVCVKENGEGSINGVQFPVIDGNDNYGYWHNLSNAITDESSSDSDIDDGISILLNQYYQPVTNSYVNKVISNIRVYYYTDITIDNQPSNHGILINIPYDETDPSKSFQVWFDMVEKGKLMYRLDDIGVFNTFLPFYK